MISRSYTDRTLKILWGRAAGRCAVPECRRELLGDATDYDPIVVIGDIAHIVAASAEGPRGDPDVSKKERDDYENLVLLCKNCHARLDGQKNSNTQERIKQLKGDHETWVRKSLPERGVGTVGWQALILQGEQRIDVANALGALDPDFSTGEPLILTLDPIRQSWPEFAVDMHARVEQLFGSADPFDARFAVFPLAPVSACIALGYELTSRPRVQLLQYHRDARSWRWPQAEAAGELHAPTFTSPPSAAPGPLVIAFHLSATVTAEQVRTALPAPVGRVDLAVAAPSTAWLKAPSQLDALAASARSVFETAVQVYPRCTEWHLFYAGPAPGAVVVGQQLNPTMCPRVQLYEFRLKSSPPYQPSLVLNG
jgi:hypothetical protein